MLEANDRPVEPAQKRHWIDPECVAVEIGEVTQGVPLPVGADAGAFLS